MLWLQYFVIKFSEFIDNLSIGLRISGLPCYPQKSKSKQLVNDPFTPFKMGQEKDLFMKQTDFMFLNSVPETGIVEVM